MFTRIPVEPSKFSDFINATDDSQKAIDTIGYTVYPKTPDGKTDYTNDTDRVEVKDKPFYERWAWTEKESKTWSAYRQKFNDAYAKYTANKSDPAMKVACENIINEVVNYDHDNHLTDRVAESVNTTQVQMKTFNVRQDILDIKTSLRTIQIRYEKAIPMNKYEKELIEKFTAVHEHVTDIHKKAKKVRIKINNLTKQLLHLWEQYPALSDKADKATNRLFIPSPKMKGSFSEMVSFKVPTAEEAQKNLDDFNQSAEQFGTQYMDMYNTLVAVEEEEKAIADVYDDSEDEYIDPFFKANEEMFEYIFEDGRCASLDVCSLDDELDEFRGAWGDAAGDMDKVHEEWCDFVDKYNVLNTVYSNFIKYTNGSNTVEIDIDDEESEEESGSSLPKAFDSDQENDMDELKAETIQKFANDLKNGSTSYFDSSDWHIILDDFEQKFDRKNFADAMERAREQHPDDVLLQIRKAQELANEHQYQPALDMLKKAEAQGPPHHPKLFFVKASVFRKLQSPDLAIPQYKRILNQDNPLLNEWKRYAYINLIEIYDAKKDFEESLRQSLELLAMFPDDAQIVETTAAAYHAAGKSKEAEDLLLRFVKHHPKNADCLIRLGHILFDNKDYKRAIEFYDKAFNTNPEEYYGARYHKGLALMEMKDYDEAAICFEECLLYYKIAVDYHVGAAKAYDKLGVQTQVIHHYRQALAIDPDCKEAIDYLLEFNRKKINS